jgi:uncharacterized protein YqgC (DUF456 family)
VVEERAVWLMLMAVALAGVVGGMLLRVPAMLLMTGAAAIAAAVSRGVGGAGWPEVILVLVVSAVLFQAGYLAGAALALRRRRPTEAAPAAGGDQ